MQNDKKNKNINLYFFVFEIPKSENVHSPKKHLVAKIK